MTPIKIKIIRKKKKTLKTKPVITLKLVMRTKLPVWQNVKVNVPLFLSRENLFNRCFLLWVTEKRQGAFRTRPYSRMVSGLICNK
jgi:hypothetical protein